MADLEKFDLYYQLANSLIERSSKEQIAETARLLALNLAHYQMNYGELPLDETLAMLDMNEPNDAQLEMLTNGMGLLCGVLGNVVSGLDEVRH